MTGGETAARAPRALTRVPSAGLVVGAIASVQFGAALARTLFDSIGPGGTVLLRLAFAALVLIVLWRPSPRPVLRDRGALALVCVFGLVLAGMNTCFYEAIDRIPLGIAVALEFVGPLGVALAGSRRPLDLLWVGLAALGVLALVNPGTASLDGVGVALALVAGVLWGAYILLNARVGREFDGGSGLALAMCVAAVATIPVGLASSGGELLTGRSLVLGAAVGVLSSAIPYSFELEALRRIAPSTFGVLMSLEPAMGALAGLLVLGQRLSARELVGMAFVILASVGVARRAGEPRADPFLKD